MVFLKGNLELFLDRFTNVICGVGDLGGLSIQGDLIYVVLGRDTGFGGTSGNFLLALYRVVGRREGGVRRNATYDGGGGGSRGQGGGAICVVGDVEHVGSVLTIYYLLDGRLTSYFVYTKGRAKRGVDVICGSSYIFGVRSRPFLGYKGDTKNGRDGGKTSDYGYYGRAIGSFTYFVLLVVAGVDLG